jgi:hypothetical protein
LCFEPVKNLVELWLHHLLHGIVGAAEDRAGEPEIKLALSHSTTRKLM